MNKSEQIDALATAFAKAQGQFQAVKKSGRNPHLKNEYITLDDIINSVRPILADNKLAYTQLLHGKNGTVKLTTVLMHESGQWLNSTVVVEAGAGNRGVNAIQALGSSITYMKRYALSAMLGIAAETDDDGNGASQPKQKAKKTAPKQSRGPKWDGTKKPANSDDGSGKPAKIKTTKWSESGKSLATAESYYQDKNGAPDWFHMTGAAGKLGFDPITDDNLDIALDALRTYAHEQQKKAEANKASD